jgi:hypothetical protein
MFRAFSRPSSGAHDCSGSIWFYLCIVVIVVLCSWSGRLTVVELQINVRIIKLENCCIWLVIYLNWKLSDFSTELVVLLVRQFQYFKICRIFGWHVFFMWRFDQISGHGLLLRGFAFTLTGHTTFGRTPLDEWSARCTSTWQHRTFTTETTIHALCGIQTHNPSKRASAVSRVRTRSF